MHHEFIHIKINKSIDIQIVQSYHVGITTSLQLYNLQRAFVSFSFRVQDQGTAGLISMAGSFL